MIEREFRIEKDKFEKRKSSILQHKLRPTMKCYTITNFILNEETNTFTFNKTFMVKGHRIEDPKTDSGTYEITEIPELEVLTVKIIVF